MKKIILALFLLAASGVAGAAAPSGNLMSVKVDPTDIPSLQRGAQLFVNYCMGCHSAQFMRYGRVAEDLRLSQDLVEQYLIFTDAQIGDTMNNAMNADLAEDWFGIAPPDLSLIVRVRGADWVYTFLNSFYRDDKSAVGVNNLLLQDLSMPHALWELQGVPVPMYSEINAGTDDARLVIASTHVPEGEGLLTPEEYREATRDLVNFLAYVSEPVRAERERLGIKVMLFLGVFLILAYLLKKEYWRDVH